MNKVTTIKRYALILVLALQYQAHGQCERQKLVASDAQTGELFGAAVAAFQGTAVVGAYFEYEAGVTRGAAYVYEHDQGSWMEATKLLASDGMDGDLFGFSIAVGADVILVGAPIGGNGQVDCGSVYVFERVGQVWVETAELFPSSPVSSMRFGTRISFAGNRALVTAPQAFSGRGAAYVFERVGAVWSQVAVLQHTGGQPPDLLGSACALWSGGAVVGSTQVDGSAGAAYIFEAAQGWAQVDKLVPADTAPQQLFGASLAASGVTLVVCAERDSEAAMHAGAAYVFEFDGQQWNETQKLFAPEASQYQRYGVSVGVDANTIAVGAEDDWIQGAIYAYRKEGSTWVHEAELKAAEITGLGDLGTGIAIEGTLVLAGADRASDAGQDSGAAYVFDIPEFVHSYCFGISCPCGNDDPVNGCANSVIGQDTLPQGARLAACGTTSVVADDLVLLLSQLPTNKTGIFYMGGTTVDAPFGDGKRCVGAGGVGIYRYLPPLNSGSEGVIAMGPGIVARSQNFSMNGHIDPGETWYFQGWYRDPMGPCGSAFNLSNGIAVSFQP